MKSGMPGTVDGTLPGVDLSPGAGSWMELGYREYWSLPPGCALIGYVSRVYVAKLAVSGLGNSTRLQQYSSSRYIEYRHSMVRPWGLDV